MNSTPNIRKIRILNALNKKPSYSLENEIIVDDMFTLIDKAAYGVDFTTVGISPEIRLKQIKGYQGAMEHIEGRIVKILDEIAQLAEKSSTETAVAVPAVIQSNEAQPPYFVQTLLNVTPAHEIILGPNKTTISKKLVISINWNQSYACIIRKILKEVFGRQTLATHTLSGKPSPAFHGLNKETKMQLKPEMVEDVIYFVTNSLNVSAKQVRQVITTTCADETKTLRIRKERNQKKLKREKHLV